ncbi:hypothetical protein CCHL11_08739 [Colletotrichum chlorophyti]|uniref:CPAF-like PDZ domain-containing protein n=1 Tax=Colletotrichum chlorophyti TaxID=708187 RepID=A0A1Q8RHD3_9PEZI|nr:hypothetical protein CCHL11_08739 [Colletotrichum chlorophyti]
MVQLTLALTRALPLAGLGVAAPAVVSSPLRRQASDDNACAELGRAFDEAISANNTNNIVVKPSTAYQCLKSVPVDVERDVALVKYLRPWLEFQSTIGILPNPPDEYLYPGVDIFSGLDNITQALENDGYDSQYDFRIDLYRLVNIKPRDGHLWWPNFYNELIIFSTPALFISVSVDGIETPKVYLYSDYEQSQLEGYNASDVKSFASTPIVDYLGQRSADNSQDHDPDAAYNEQLYSAASSNMLKNNYSRRYEHTILPDESIIEFSNGTNVTVVNTARLLANFSGITSGEDVHQRFEVPRNGAREEGVADERVTGFVPELEAYPEPFVVHEDKYVSGYLFNDSSLEDTAVLAVNMFITQNFDPSRDGNLSITESILRDPLDFVRVVGEFAETSRSQNKSKLIIDLQGNPGGLITNVMALYATLFPEVAQEGHMNLRARAHPAFAWLGKSFEEQGADLNSMQYPIGWAGYIDEDLKNFTSWEDFYGPEEINGEEYTNIHQPRDVLYAREGIPGYWEVPKPWFKPEDTIIVTDGHCASACSYVVGMMTRELGISVVAMGGRPIDAPMQAIGGTKGGPVASLYAYQIGLLGFRDISNVPDDVDLTPFVERQPPLLLGRDTISWTVNSANVYLDDDADGIPVQFRYEAANCKLYYTWDTLTDMTSLWTAVADVKWNGGRCVAGSTTNDDATMGSSTVGYSEEVMSNFAWAAGPGDVSERSGSNDGGGGGANGTDGGSDGNDGAGDDTSAAGSIRESWGVLSVVTLATVLTLL